ncbi:hypothetical protein PanWU01x14_292790 [Parasponia andersonii]|uniref:Uncharacterized protein n=1 Tax=Parasponia andersonii TaxID=3476 RepID=A0A2P5AWS8_PARAD|nr:hypothetical protein PanWU01x14_292790 [Parasponia andersonii]
MTKPETQENQPPSASSHYAAVGSVKNASEYIA